jgi:gluconolactonase
VVADYFVKPNGLAFSPDERSLFVSDTGFTHSPDPPVHIRAFDVDGPSLRNSREFAVSTWGLFDGFRVDIEGNIWTSAGEGINCYTAEGDLIGRINMPELVSNCTFGGPKRHRLFITATSSLYAVFLNARGIQTP